MNTITIERELLEQALGALVRAEMMYGQPNQAVQAALRAALAKPVEPDAPIRSYRLTLQLDADTLSDLASAMMNLSLRADRGELTRGVSGGPDSGYIYELLHDQAQTHETYFSQLREYLARKKAKAEGGAA